MSSLSDTGMVLLHPSALSTYIIIQLMVVFWRYSANLGVLFLADPFDVPLEEVYRAFLPRQAQTIG